MTHRRDRIRVVGSTLALCAASVIVLTGCPKKEEPPAPAPTWTPPPPPPPPPTLGLVEMATDIGADARVQFADETWEVEDEDLGKAVIGLADAFARGDSDKLRSLLTREPSKQLDYLLYSGQWDLETEEVESVRVVWFREGPARDVGEPNFDLEQVEAALRESVDLERLNQVIEAQIGGEIPLNSAAIADAYAEIIAKYGPELDPEDLPEDINFDDPESILTDENTVRAFLAAMGTYILGIENGDPDMGIDPDPAEANRITDDLLVIFAKAAARWLPINKTTVVLIAVQQPNGAYLLGWSAEKALGTYAFSNVQTVGTTKRRASQFDDLGIEGFTEGVAIAAVYRDAGLDLDESVGGNGAGGSGAPDRSTPPPPNEAPATTPEPPTRDTPRGPVRLPPSTRP